MANQFDENVVSKNVTELLISISELFEAAWDFLMIFSFSITIRDILKFNTV